MQEQKIWHAGVLGMTLNVDEGRITIFRSTLEDARMAIALSFFIQSSV